VKICPSGMASLGCLSRHSRTTSEWRQANAEALPFGDNEFDAVLSCIGVMFAPHHQASADELVRVCKPGGRIGLVSWTPEGYIGQLFATMKPYAPAPPPGVSPPPMWGSEEHVRGLLGGSGSPTW
jgi:SAM-dependent methyltransferase